MLELVDLSRRYGETVALDGLSLQAKEGKLVGFVGPNGAGKTTAMRIALGVLEPDAGEVRWQGRPVRRDEQRQFGYMPEERGPLSEDAGRPAASLPSRAARAGPAAAAAAVERWTERLGLGEQAGGPSRSSPSATSSGCSSPAALVHDPLVLILDEPFSGLDPIGTEVMSEVLRERASEGAAVIFSSHQLELVERLCDDVAIVSRGRIVAAGAVEELRSERSRPRLRVKVDADADDWLAGVPGAQLVDGRDGDVLVELGEGADDQLVLDAARRAGRVRRFEPARPTLAELFREVVEQ